MTTYFNVMFQVFSYGTLIAGSLLLVLAIVVAILWSIIQLHNVLPYARGVLLVVAVRARGSRDINRFFWSALRERASASNWESENIIREAQKCLTQPDPAEKEE